MLTRVLRAGTLVLMAGGFATVPGAAEEYGPDLESYRDLIGVYQAGNVEPPVRHVGGWGPVWIESTVDRLLRWCDNPAGGTVTQVRAAQGAFLVHAHAALVSQDLGLRMRDHVAHTEAARRLLRWLGRQYRRSPGTWPREARGLRPRDFYLALASGELLVARHETARELAEESLWQERRDGEMRLLAGCALETEALIRRQTRGGWHEETLHKAELRFREALEDDPTLQEARLRLGWVLVRRRRFDDAEAFLTFVARSPGFIDRRALAWLFLSRVHESRGDGAARIEACRQAVRLAPHMQAAHVGLAHALEASGGDEASQAVLLPFFLDRSRAWTRHDPWSEYPYGPPELRQNPFETLVKRLTGQ